jgi:hypothetical protein
MAGFPPYLFVKIRYIVFNYIGTAPAPSVEVSQSAIKTESMYFFCVYTHFPPPGMTIQDISNQRRYKKRRL